MNLIKTEFKKIFNEIKYYFPDYIVGFIIDIFILLLIINTSTDMDISFFGYISWVLAGGVISEASLFIATEKQLGILQNLMIKPYSIIQICMAKTIVWFLINSVKLIIITFLLRLTKFPQIYFELEFVIIIVLVCGGMLGVSLIMASITLMFTKVASFETIINYSILYLSGSIFNVPYLIRYTILYLTEHF